MVGCIGRAGQPADIDYEREFAMKCLISTYYVWIDISVKFYCPVIDTLFMQFRKQNYDILFKTRFPFNILVFLSYLLE